MFQTLKQTRHHRKTWIPTQSLLNTYKKVSWLAESKCTENWSLHLSPIYANSDISETVHRQLKKKTTFGNFFDKNVKFLAMFWHSKGNFPESQLPSFFLLRYGRVGLPIGPRLATNGTYWNTKDSVLVLKLRFMLQLFLTAVLFYWQKRSTLCYNENPKTILNFNYIVCFFFLYK